MLAFEDARRKVIEVVGALALTPPQETVALGDALGRVLAETVTTDRDYPPFDRSTRDGYAVRAADLHGGANTLVLIGEIRAGQDFAATVRAGECVQIMTGAAAPASTDAVVMIEYTHAETHEGRTRIRFDRAAEPGQNVVRRGMEARAGQKLLAPGSRLGYAELALAGQVGRAELAVAARPRIAILSTGDEVVAVDATPGPLEIRNGNSVSLAAQVRLAGGEPVLLGNVADRAEELRHAIVRGLDADALVISGGVSAGKYDLVEGVLGELGTQIHFDAVAIRPGRPAVFGTCRGKPVFGLPGNPVSTMVTFELLLLPAIDILSGGAPRPLPLFRAKLGAEVRQKAGVTHFLPSKVEWTSGEPVVRELKWQGSGDIVALAEANCFLMVPQAKLEWQAGEWVEVLPRRAAL
jgi:molybdopterin molybdotransferase